MSLPTLLCGNLYQVFLHSREGAILADILEGFWSGCFFVLTAGLSGILNLCDRPFDTPSRLARFLCGKYVMPIDDLEQLRLENSELRQALAEMKSQLMQAQKLTSVGVLASSITHEFNNILMTVINYAKMGLRHKEPATRDKAFDRILAAGQRAAKITTGMLSYARGKISQREAFRLSQLIEDVLVLVEKDLQVHRIRLEKNFDENVWAEVNSGQIQQVLINLIINARQAMDAGGTLFIGVAANREAGTSEITVRDSGSGIPAEKLPRIFDQFYSTKTPDEQGQGGSGLGLALCKEIIDSHRGRIRVESTVGRGTTFTLRFPMIPAPTLVRPAATQKAG